MRGFFEDGPENQPLPKIRSSNMRRSWTEHAALKKATGAGEDWAAEIVMDTAIVMPDAQTTAIRVLPQLVDFADWTEEEDAEYAGRELEKETLECE